MKIVKYKYNKPLFSNVLFIFLVKLLSLSFLCAIISIMILYMLYILEKNVRGSTKKTFLLKWVYVGKRLGRPGLAGVEQSFYHTK